MPSLTFAKQGKNTVTPRQRFYFQFKQF